ncbi:hypothetical protein SAMN04487894_104356 [Niabella drilacis]|uniref:DUF2306 domain-containing protein n=2 Tax=Niabella drilacis (strain DSM 25811 / CCM 8410 / CCUG 62505 / LMG 26954 / E90) TaxID=1285928 RepID=A0A1G6QCL4_NIADE|nr:hypothetical protein SAMN04487894_104356 [Niabella drilacis]
MLFFTAVAVISLSGFFFTYLRFFPDFDRFRVVIHIHFMAFICWFLLLVIQPVLIRKRQYLLHRKLGKLSWLLAPVLVVTILLLVKDKVQRELDVSAGAAAMTAFIGLLDVVSFSVCYSVAMINRHNVRWHVAFIIGATLIVFNPGMSRVFNHFRPGSGLPAAVILPFIVPLIIITVEKLRFKRPVLKSPYLLFVLLWLAEILLLMTIPQTDFWKHLVIKFAS